jgi:hypothetical protein
MGDTIMNVQTKDELSWKQKHLELIRNCYKDSPFFTEVYDDFRAILLNDYGSLASLNEALIKAICCKLGIVTEFISSSTMDINTRREERIIDICSRLSGDVYCSGIGAKVYQTEENFLKRGIQLKYSVYTPFEYAQVWEGYCFNVSILDYLFNCGYDWANVKRYQNSEED